MRRLLHTAFAGLAVLATACADKPPTQAASPPDRLVVSIYGSEGTASLSQKSATLEYGRGIFLRAGLSDGSGKPISAKPTWRTTNAGVAIVTAMADSVPAEGVNRAAITSIGPGTALIIASFGTVADTATITVVQRTDTSTALPVRPLKFNLTVRAIALVAPGDSAHRVTQLLPGARVTMTLLPTLPGDTLPPDATRFTREWELAPVVADNSGLVNFYNIDVTRYRLRVEPPAGSPYAAAVLEFAAPRYSTMFTDAWLRKP